jgi:hypothetical protein
MHPVNATTLLLQGYHCPINPPAAATFPLPVLERAQQAFNLSCDSCPAMRTDQRPVSVERLLHRGVSLPLFSYDDASHRPSLESVVVFGPHEASRAVR